MNQQNSHEQKPQHQNLHERFLFHSHALPKNHSCKVVRFSGIEAMSTPYIFDITLINKEDLHEEVQKDAHTNARDSSPSTRICIDTLSLSRCTLTITRDHGAPVHIHGFAAKITQGAHINGWTFYTVRLVPQCMALKRTVDNAIFLDKTVQHIVSDAMGQCGIIAPKHDFILHHEYPVREFSMQYNECTFDFINAHLEREGIYYYFAQNEGRDEDKDTREAAGYESMIFTDAPMTHTHLPDTPTLLYKPISGLEHNHSVECIHSFTFQKIPLPKSIFVRDYDWKNPNVNIEASASVDPMGIGVFFFYGDGFESVEEGKRLATIRAQALRCHARTYSGTSAVPTLRAGYLFTLEEHYRKDFCTDYCLTKIEHEGSQEGYLSSVLGIPLENSVHYFYRNTFTCIPATVQFRPERVTERKKMGGVIHAFIDAASDAHTPELDEHGRYKVVFPQDTSGKGRGKASCWLRRAQPSVGASHGTILPLAPGVEVLIGFIDGNPDKAYISSAIANTETGSMNNAATATMSGITTAGGGGLVFNDTGKKQGLHLSTGSGRSSLYMGSGSDDTSILQSPSFTAFCSGTQATMAGLAASTHAGMSTAMSVGFANFARLAALLTGPLANIASALQKANEKESNEGLQLAWNTANAALKATHTLVSMLDESIVFGLTQKDVNYATSIYGSHAGSTVALATESTPMTYLTFIVTQLTSLASHLGAASFEATQAGVANTKSRDAAEEQQALLDTCIEEKTALFDASTAAFLRENTAVDFHAYATTDPSCEAYIEYMASHGFTNIASYVDTASTPVSFVKDLYIQLFCTYGEAPVADNISTLYAQAASLESAKALSAAAKKSNVATIVTNDITELLAESLSMFLMLFRRMKHKDLGGVRIFSPDQNILISSKTNTQLNSAVGVNLISLPGIDERAMRTPVANMSTLHGIGATIRPLEPSINLEQDKTYISTETEQIRHIAYEDAEYLALKHTLIHSGTSIQMTNKMSPDAAPEYLSSPIAFTEQYMATPKKVANAKMTAELSQTLMSLNKPTYSEIRLHDDGTKEHSLTLSNVGTKLSLRQIPKDDTANGGTLELLRKDAAGTNNVGAVIMDADTLSLSYTSGGSQDANKARALTLKDSSLKVSFGADVRMEMKDKNLTLAATDASTLTLTDDKAQLQTKSMDITCEKDAQIKGQSITLDANEIHLKGAWGSMDGAKTGQLTIKGSMISIG